MFRRKLKKERSRYRLKIFFVSLLFLTFAIAGVELLLMNFSFGRASYISPIAKEDKSKLTSLENALDKNRILYASVNTNSDGSFTVELRDGGEVILSSKKELVSQLTSLQLILARLTIEGKKLKKLDFRFDNPVVLF